VESDWVFKKIVGGLNSKEKLMVEEVLNPLLRFPIIVWSIPLNSLGLGVWVPSNFCGFPSFISNVVFW